MAWRLCGLLGYAPLMSVALPPLPSPESLIRVRWRSGTLARDLEAFRASQGFSHEDLATWLGLDITLLPLLAEAERPDPSDGWFHQQCAVLAQRTGCDAFALRTMLRWLAYGG